MKMKNNLMKTTPNIKLATTGTPNIPRKSNEYKPATRPIVSSHQISQHQPASYLRHTSPAKSDKSSVRSVQSGEVSKKVYTPE